MIVNKCNGEWDAKKFLEHYYGLGLVFINSSTFIPLSELPDSYIIQLTDKQKVKLYANK